MTVAAATVTQYYTGIFRQAPSAPVQAAYEAMADANTALNSMLSAANVSVDPVVRLYQTAFNRVPDSAGMTAWVVPYSGGALSLQQIANGFTQSTEFTTLYPSSMTNAQFVGALYWNILQRQGEDAGIKGWVDALNSGGLTRAQVLLGFSDSGEFKANVEPNVNAFLSKCAANTETYTGSLFEQGGSSGTTYVLTTNVDTINATSNATVEGTQATFQALDTITGTGTNNTLKLVDSGTAAWALPAASVTGFQTVSLRNINGTTTAVAQEVTIVVGIDPKVNTDTVVVNYGSLTQEVVLGATAATAADAIAAAINALAGATIAEGDGVDTVLVTAPVAGTPLPSIALSNWSDIADAADLSIATTQANVVGTGGTDTLDADNFVGMTNFIADRATSAISIVDVNAGTAITMNGGSVANGALTAAFDAGNSTITFNATNGTGTSTGRGAVTLTSSAASDLTTINVNSSGGTNRVGTMTFNGQPTAININASSAFDTSGIVIGTNVANQVVTVSGSAANRGATSSAAPTAAVVLGTLDTDIDGVNAAGLSAGGVSLTIANTLATVTGGTGNDYITTAAGAQQAAINAGGGSDVLIQANTNAIASLTAGNYFSGFEVYQANDGVSLDMDLLATNNTIGAIQINNAGGGNAITDMSATQGQNITILAQNGAATLALKSATGTSDVMNILVSDLDLTGSEGIAVAVDWTIANVETINITAFDDLTVATMANVSGVTNLNVSGGGDVSITTGATTISSGLNVSFAGITATSSIFDFSAALAQPLVFVGSAGADTVTDSVIGGNVIRTGAGQDSITLTAKTGGTSNDVITAGAAGDTVVVTNAKGNTAIKKITMTFADGDSVITAAVTGTGYSADVMDSVTGIDFANAAAAAAGHVITFDTAQAATAVTFSGTAVTFGTTAVTNAYDFYVYNTGAGGVTYVYQDTDGDRIIENGEFGIRLVGAEVTASTNTEFAVTSGNLVLTTV